MFVGHLIFVHPAWFIIVSFSVLCFYLYFSILADLASRMVERKLKMLVKVNDVVMVNLRTYIIGIVFSGLFRWKHAMLLVCTRIWRPPIMERKPKMLLIVNGVVMVKLRTYLIGIVFSGYILDQNTQTDE